MIYHYKNLVLVRKGRAFYATLYQEVFFGNPGGGGSLKIILLYSYTIRRLRHTSVSKILPSTLSRELYDMET